MCPLCVKSWPAKSSKIYFKEQFTFLCTIAEDLSYKSKDWVHFCFIPHVEKREFFYCFNYYVGHSFFF